MPHAEDGFPRPGGAAGRQVAIQPRDPLAVMTFNIRYGTANDGANRWENRREFLFDVVKIENADVVGLPEALDGQIREIVNAIPHYAVVGVGRGRWPDARRVRRVPVLERYTWPGHVRELRNVVERMAILTRGDRLTVESIPLEVRMPQTTRQTTGLQEVRDSAERERLRQALDQTDWSVSGAARLLGTERTSLHKRFRALGLRRR